MDHFVQESYFRFIFENSLDAILLMNPEGKVCRANMAACEMFQRVEEELLGICWDEMADYDDPNLQTVLRKREEKGWVRAEISLLRKDGTKFPADCTSAIFKDYEGKGWTAVLIRDLTVSVEVNDSQLKTEEETRYFASYDYVTGILNRRAFLQKLKIEMKRAGRKEKPLCLILADLDHFKQVNDEFGHLKGDEVLRQSARCMGKNLRPCDILGRFGGDEFIMCLPDTDIKAAAAVAERLREQIEKMELIHDGKKFSITASFGVTHGLFSSEEELDVFISRTDNNMYRAKMQRNSVFASEGERK
ncbi:hypothetical protein SDC9_74665 [bioreactor metagenome]|uniref:GGDEF domain-containing protein n=1 Tax=bioreactor metagenome TaxID=1076179 RepID=A0A644YI18_9ZZZZ